MSNVSNAVDSIRKIFDTYCHDSHYHILENVFHTHNFMKWPASTHKHHCWEGGLIEHTSEVIQLAFAMGTMPDVQNKNVDLNIVFFAALMHDFGKIYDYEPCTINDEWPCGYKKTAHYYKTHHIVASYTQFRQWAGEIVNQEFYDGVGHAILAHHGRKEYGSPVTPQTREAWLVHLADMASVNVIERRINDV